MSDKLIKTKLTEQFPRSNNLPSQSSKYWAKEKDRYLRQLLLNDLECESGRETLVYFSHLSQGISHTDADDLSEVIEGLKTRDIDLIIQTPGGAVDAVEKLVTVLKQRLDSYRVIVPSWAKSGGTVIAMSSKTILLGVNSELGPIDPQMFLRQHGMQFPCEYIVKDESVPHVIRQQAEDAIKRMRELAKKYLEEGMLKGKTDDEVDVAIKKISSSNTYKSHGAVIDFSEAESLGLSVEWMEPQDSFWKRVWLLYCCYQYDTEVKRIGKIFEGSSYSIQRALPHQ